MAQTIRKLSEADTSKIAEDLERLATELTGEVDAPVSYVPLKSCAEKAVGERMTSRNDRPVITRAQLQEMLEITTDSKGRPSGYRGGVHNVTTIFNKDPKIAGALGYDLMMNQVVIRKKVKFSVRDVPDIFVRDGGQEFSKAHEAALAAYLGASTEIGGYGISATAAVIEQAVMNAAMLNAFDPLIEEITGTKWDRTPRLATAFIRWFKLEDNAYTRQLSKFLVSFVQRRFEPGSKFDYVPVLVGRKQGTYKSTVIEVLSLGRFGEFRTPQEIADPKKMNEATDGAALMEVPELAALMSLHHNVVKSTLSSRKDRARGAYSKNAETRLRSWLMIGTSNDGEFLRDPTGNRRFWPVFLNDRLAEAVDIETMRKEIHQVYAEALWVYREMRMKQPEGDLPLYMVGEAAVIATELQTRASVATPEQALAGWLTDWLLTPDTSKFAEIDVDGRSYRSKFCLREAHEAYHAAFTENAKVNYDKAATAMMSGAVALVNGVSKGSSARFDMFGVQQSYVVDDDWLRSQIIGEQQPAHRTQTVAVNEPENVIHINGHGDLIPW